ncbi:CDGSH iron-sulfur domain-containing protein [Cyanobium sp. Morenito 9A2]|uniref:CDGSH iron-sulfur domain-containing protein n=1 Tax=Cyanobium sp. Morenito 9A2 TaxID=2823718 RepID=UPI0020CE272D|nr:CDGSH iron-sulfur domain-containing protein [Cyanobium sp. Morenito 9A2]MCP9850357.1 CDGSH iron-sulfur domain-containing protein [Cyanobium sp. Morenito 9A2]
MADSSPKPTALALDAGTHALCRCGLSKNGAFCDGSHKGTGTTPGILSLEAPQTVYLCSCGSSANPPYCDGSHTKLAASAVPSPRAAAAKPWWQFWG